MLCYLSSHLSKQRPLDVSSLYRPSHYAAYIGLDQCNLLINLCQEDLDCTTWICKMDIKFYFFKMEIMLFLIKG